MKSAELRTLAAVLFAASMFIGCQPSDGVVSNSNGDRNTTVANSNTTNSSSEQAPDNDGFIPSGAGVEKEKPAPGTGNVQGKVLYNEKPAAGIEVKLCETFSQYLSGCGGKTFTVKTDEQGEYLIKNVPAGTYEGLTAKVFDTNYYVFATSGYVSSAKYRIEDGKTYFAPDSNLFKGDLKILSPKAGSRIPASGVEVKWDAYPDAAYYKLSILGDSANAGPTDYDLINKRVDGNSYLIDKPLSAGKFRVKIDAFNANDVKLAEGPNDVEFTVTGEAGK